MIRWLKWLRAGPDATRGLVEQINGLHKLAIKDRNGLEGAIKAVEARCLALETRREIPEERKIHRPRTTAEYRALMEQGPQEVNNGT
jgi:hypothetical protein